MKKWVNVPDIIPTDPTYNPPLAGIPINGYESIDIYADPFTRPAS